MELVLFQSREHICFNTAALFDLLAHNTVIEHHHILVIVHLIADGFLCGDREIYRAYYPDVVVVHITYARKQEDIHLHFLVDLLLDTAHQKVHTAFEFFNVVVSEQRGKSRTVGTAQKFTWTYAALENFRHCYKNGISRFIAFFLVYPVKFGNVDNKNKKPLIVGAGFGEA